ncbi:MAG: DUF1559 domain-containing protein [Planctomycetota bacterium]
MLICFLLPVPRRLMERARRNESKNNLKQIGLALHNYNDAFQQFPVGTVSHPDLAPEARLSWIVGLLPDLDQATLSREIDQSKGWSDAVDAPHLKSNIPCLLNYWNGNAPLRDGSAVSHYVGIAGVGKEAANLPISDQRVGAFGYDRQVRVEDVTDGLSNTMFVTEVSQNLGPWSRGGMATIRALTTKPYINGPDGIGNKCFDHIQVLFGDGSVRVVSKDIDPAIFEALATIHGGEAIGEF